MRGERYGVLRTGFIFGIDGTNGRDGRDGINREDREFRKLLSLNSLNSLNSLIYHINQRTNLLSEGAQMRPYNGK